MLKQSILNLIRPRRGHATVRPLVHTSACVRYQTRILNPDGSVASERAFKNNLILDQGLNNVAASSWSQLFQYCAVGTGTTPVKRDSGLTTFTRAGTTVTASANFFEAADVGRLFKFDSGAEMYVTAYTDPLNVTVGTSGTIAAAEGTVWYVNQTGLTAETARTQTQSGGATENKSTFSVNTWTHQRQFLFPAVGAPVTYREIGWSHTSGAPNLFGRDIIPGARDSLSAGQQYQVIVTLILTISPSTITAAPEVGTGGMVTVGTINFQYIGSRAFSTLYDTNVRSLEPSATWDQSSVKAANATFTLNAGPSNWGGNISGGEGANLYPSAYSAGSFSRSRTGTFAVTQANYAIHGYIFQDDGGNGVLALKFTAPFTKDSLHTLSVVLTLTWGRTLVN